MLMLLSQKQDPIRNESYNLIKRCKCVKYFLWIVDELHWMIYLSLCIFFSWTWAIYIYIYISSFFRHVLWTCGIPSLGMHLFSLFFSLSCLLGMWHTFFVYASFISFCIAHILDDNLGERDMIELGVLFCEWMEIIAIFKW